MISVARLLDDDTHILDPGNVPIWNHVRVVADLLGDATAHERLESLTRLREGVRRDRPAYENERPQNTGSASRDP